MNFLKWSSHLAPTAPSTTRWSHDNVTVIYVATRWPFLSSGTTRFSAPPTAKMHAFEKHFYWVIRVKSHLWKNLRNLTWGGLMTAAKDFMPNIPRFDMVNVPPLKFTNALDKKPKTINGLNNLEKNIKPETRAVGVCWRVLFVPTSWHQS